jgi:hypothetical protein
LEFKPNVDIIYILGRSEWEAIRPPDEEGLEAKMSDVLRIKNHGW